MRRRARILTALVSSFGIAEESHQLATLPGMRRLARSSPTAGPALPCRFWHHTGHSPLSAYNPADFAPDPRREARDAARARPGSRSRDGANDRRGQAPQPDPREQRQAIGRSDGRRRHQGAAGGRSSLRSPDPALEPAHAPLHLRRAGRDSHHRSPPDGGAAQAGDRVRHRGRGEGRGRPLRRDEEAGPGLGPGVGRAVRDAVRQPALARRPAHQLPTRSASGSSVCTSCASSRRAAVSTCSPPRSACRWRPSCASSSTTSAASPTCSASRTR